MPLYNSEKEQLAFQQEIHKLQSLAQYWHQGFLRYEIIRKMSPTEYTELWKEALKGGAMNSFDNLVDKKVREYFEKAVKEHQEKTNE